MMIRYMLSAYSSFHPSTQRIGAISSHFMSTYTHDFAVIGGGSGGLAAAKEAAKKGAKVVLFDHVTPSHRGTTWGFAGTCVNVGCIPKKLFHYSALLGESLHDLKHTGWEVHSHSTHNWSEMVTTVTNYIRKLNFSYRSGARASGVEYINARASFASPECDETLLQYQLKGEKRTVKARYVLVSVGGRPTLPSSIQGFEHAITSDDIFFMKQAPGRTLVVGGGYIAMECAGFLTGLGYPTSVSVRSKPLRNFDSQVAEKITSVMTELGTDFLIGKTPKSLYRNIESGPIHVTFDDGSEGEYDTVLIATGRTPATGSIGLPKTAALDPKSMKLIANPATNLVKGTSSIYAVGDCLQGSPELTPVAVKDGEMLARRLFGGSSAVFDKRFIPTTVFTPSEYGSVGLSEEEAIKNHPNVECYLYEWPSLERAALHREKPMSRRADEADIEQGNNCFTKLVCAIQPDGTEKVVGFHFVGPNAGEVTQGFALAVKLGATKADFDSLVGIHPTDAEAMCGLDITKSSGADFVAAGGCGGGKCG